MSLIKDFQQENSGVPKPPATVKIPKPAVAPPTDRTVETPNLISAFEEGNPADLQIAPDATALPESVAAPPPQAQPQPGGLNLTQYLGNTTPVPLPAFDAPVVPQGTSLWKDTQINLGVPDLYDPKIVTTQEPTLYRNPLSTSSAAVDQANSNLRGTVQRTNASLDEQARNAQASQAALQNATRSALPNTPDATKPWYGQVTDGLGRWAFGSPAAEAAARRGEVNVATGSYGVNGAGAGGLFNTISNWAIGLPLAVVSEKGRQDVNSKVALYKLENREVFVQRPDLFDKVGAPQTAKKVRFNDLSAREQKDYAAREFNRGIAWTGFNLPVTDLTGKTSYGAGLYTLQRNVRLAEPNPELTGKPTAGAFYSAKKTTEGFFEEPQTAIPEILYNLLTPGNKIDIAGEVVGRAIGFVAKPVVKKVAPFFRRAAGTKPVQAEIVEPFTKPSVPSSAIEVSRAVRTTNTPPLEVEFPTPGVSNSGAPVTPNYNQGVILKLDPSQQLPASKPIIPAYKGAVVRPSGAEEQLGKIIPEAPISRPVAPVAVTREGKPVLALPPAVENIPDYKPTLTQVFPKTDAVGLAAEVGVGTPGRVIEFTPETSTRSLENVIAHLSKTPEGRQILQDYTGKTWEEFREHIARNHSDIDVGQFGSIGTKVEELAPSPPKLSDLTEQATELAEQRALVEQPIQQLEKLFDEAVDLGRRTDDRLPLTKLTEEDFYRAIDNGAKPPLLDAALNVFERDTAEALRTNNTEALSKVRFEYQKQQIAKALELHNAALEPRPLLTAGAKFPRYISTNAPPVVYHGTALARFTPDYNVETFGSRGELGSGLYTTTNKVEAESYAKAVVGENRSAEIAYEPLKPQVVELDTSAFKAPLNARAEIAAQTDEAKAVINSFSDVVDKRAVARAILDSPKKTYADYVALAERRLAETNASEKALQTYNKRLSKRLRGLGYDAIHDPQSGWFTAIDNGKLKAVKAEPVAEPASAVESAIARYNADTTAAASYPDHLTSDANLRDSAYKVLDQTRAGIDEKLAEVQQQAQAEIANAVQEPVVKVEPAFVERQAIDEFKEQIRKYGKPTTDMVVREETTGSYVVVSGDLQLTAARELRAEDVSKFEMAQVLLDSPSTINDKIQLRLVAVRRIQTEAEARLTQENKAVEAQAAQVFESGNTEALADLGESVTVPVVIDFPERLKAQSEVVDFSSLDSNGLRAKASELGVSVQGINFRSKPQREALRKQLKEAAAKQQEPVKETTNPELSQPTTEGITQKSSGSTHDKVIDRLAFKASGGAVESPKILALRSELKYIEDLLKHQLPEDFGYDDIVEELQLAKDNLAKAMAEEQKAVGNTSDLSKLKQGEDAEPVLKTQQIEDNTAALRSLMDERNTIAKSYGDNYNAAYNDPRHIEIQKQIDQITFGKYEPAPEPPNTPTNLAFPNSSADIGVVDFSKLDSNGLRAKASELGVSVQGINFRSKPQREALRKKLGEAAATSTTKEPPAPTAQTNPHSTTTDLLNSANEEPPSLCNL